MAQEKGLEKPNMVLDYTPIQDQALPFSRTVETDISLSG